MENKATRAIHKKKQFEDISDENSDGTDDTELESYPRKKSKKITVGNNKKLKIESPQFPTFSPLPDIPKPTPSVLVSKSVSSTSNEVISESRLLQPDQNVENSRYTINDRKLKIRKALDEKVKDVNVNKTTQNIELFSKKILKGGICHGNKISHKKTGGTSTERRQLNKSRSQASVKDKSGKENIALNDQHDKSGKNVEGMSMAECPSEINVMEESIKTGKEHVRLKPNATSTSNKTDTSKPICSKTLQENANNKIPSSDEDNFDFHDREEEFDRTYEPDVDIDHINDHLSDSTSEADEKIRTPPNKSLENRTEEEEPKKDDLIQIGGTAKTDKTKTDIIVLLKQMYEKITKMEQRQLNMKNSMEEIKQLLLSRTETLTHPTNLPKLPLQTYTDSKHLEEKINREEAQKDYVIKRLCLAARGASDKECAKRVMEKLMSNHVGTFYSWQGSGGKKDSFKNTIMMEAVRRTIL